MMPASSTTLALVSGYSTAHEPGIHAFTFDETTGLLTQHGIFSGIRNPSFLSLHPNGHWLYSVSETNQSIDGESGQVFSMLLSRTPFSISTQNSNPTDGDWPCHTQLDNTGQWLFIANYGSGSVSVFPVEADGSLAKKSAHVQHAGSGMNSERQKGPHAHSVTLTPDNKFALVADLGLDKIVIYRFDPSNGNLSLHAETQTKPGSGPRHLVFHKNSRWLYVTNELDNTVTFYEYEKTKGTLFLKQSLTSLPAFPSESSLADIHISPSGKRLYASNRGHNSLTLYNIGIDGFLTLIANYPCGGNWPRNFAISPNGRFMLVVNQYSHEVCVLPVDDDGALGLPLSRMTVPGASCVILA